MIPPGNLENTQTVDEAEGIWGGVMVTGEVDAPQIGNHPIGAEHGSAAVESRSIRRHVIGLIVQDSPGDAYQIMGYGPRCLTGSLWLAGADNDVWLHCLWW